MPWVVRGKSIYRADTGKKVQTCTSHRNAEIALAIRERAVKGEKKK